MAELTTHKLGLAFYSLNLQEKDYLTMHQLTQAVNELNAGVFDPETFNQLWQQCRLNSRGEVKLSQFGEVVMKGEAILLEGLQQIRKKMFAIDNRGGAESADKMEQLDLKREKAALMEQRDSINISLQIIRHPFRIQPTMIKTSTIGQGNLDVSTAFPNPDEHLFDYDSKDTAFTLTVIFYITALALFFAVITSFYICKYRTIIVYLIILSGYGFQTVSRKIIRFNLYLLLTESLVEIIWLAVQTSSLWSPQPNGHFSPSLDGYLKIVVIVSALHIVANGFIGFFYLSQTQIDQLQIYVLTIFDRQISMRRDLDAVEINRNPLAYLVANLLVRKAQPVQESIEDDQEEK